MARDVINNRIVPNYLSAQQERLYAMTNTTCCAWINTSGEVENQLYKNTEQNLWL